MAVSSGFFNSVNHDRTYDAEEISSMFDGIILDGVYQGFGNVFNVKPGSLPNTVVVESGRAWFDHTWTLNDNDFAIELPVSNIMMPRYDAIVIEVNLQNRKNKITYFEGTPASDPQKIAPANTDKIKYYPIAYILRPAESEMVTTSDIYTNIGGHRCPIVTGVLEVMSSERFLEHMDEEFNKFTDEKKQEFATWFQGIKDLAGEEPVLELANRIEALEAKIPTFDPKSFTVSPETSEVTLNYSKDLYKKINIDAYENLKYENVNFTGFNYYRQINPNTTDTYKLVDDRYVVFYNVNTTEFKNNPLNTSVRVCPVYVIWLDLKYCVYQYKKAFDLTIPSPSYIDCSVISCAVSDNYLTFSIVYVDRSMSSLLNNGQSNMYYCENPTILQINNPDDILNSTYTLKTTGSTLTYHQGTIQKALMSICENDNYVVTLWAKYLVYNSNSSGVHDPQIAVSSLNKQTGNVTSTLIGLRSLASTALNKTNFYYGIGDIGELYLKNFGEDNVVDFYISFVFSGYVYDDQNYSVTSNGTLKINANNINTWSFTSDKKYTQSSAATIAFPGCAKRSILYSNKEYEYLEKSNVLDKAMYFYNNGKYTYMSKDELFEENIYSRFEQTSIPDDSSNLYNENYLKVNQTITNKVLFNLFFDKNIISVDSNNAIAKNNYLDKFLLYDNLILNVGDDEAIANNNPVGSTTTVNYPLKTVALVGYPSYRSYFKFSDGNYIKVTSGYSLNTSNTTRFFPYTVTKINTEELESQ